MPALSESMNVLDFSLSLNLPAISHRRNLIESYKLSSTLVLVCTPTLMRSHRLPCALALVCFLHSFALIHATPVDSRQLLLSFDANSLPGQG